MTPEVKKPLSIFCSYSRRDEEHLNDLRDWLRDLEREGRIEWWHDREIVPGQEYEKDIDKNLRNADIILLLVSPPFMASDYVYAKEVSVAVDRHERGEARVIPIIVRRARWERAPFAKLQALPEDAKPVVTWLDRDEAWYSVAEGVERAVEELSAERHERAAREQYRKVAEEAWADKKLSDAEVRHLGKLAGELSLSAATSSDIERDVMGDFKEAILKREEQRARVEEHLSELDDPYTITGNQALKNPITAKQLTAEYRANPVRTNVKYASKNLVVQGRVATIGHGGIGLDAEADQDAQSRNTVGSWNLVCSMSEDPHLPSEAAVAELAALDKGQIVTVSGQYTESTLANPWLRRCRIISASKE